MGIVRKWRIKLKRSLIEIDNIYIKDVT